MKGHLMRIFLAILASIFISGAASAETISNNIKNFKYNGADITIAVGDTVVWTNQDGARHTATARDGSFDTGSLKKGKSGEITFSTAGTFEYFCKFHRKMEGRVVVK